MDVGCLCQRMGFHDDGEPRRGKQFGSDCRGCDSTSLSRISPKTLVAYLGQAVSTPPTTAIQYIMGNRWERVKDLLSQRRRGRRGHENCFCSSKLTPLCTYHRHPFKINDTASPSGPDNPTYTMTRKICDVHSRGIRVQRAMKILSMMRITVITT